ncbi:TPA: hypothetical protein QCR24_005076 [Bacillus cereus]|nr:hypothetical protein [Bacillus cereus]
MKYKDMVECMDENCRTVVISKHVDGLSCVRCGGPTRPMPFKPIEKQTGHGKTKEVLEGIKEVTEAVNECVAALEKLEQVMGKFNKNDGVLEFNVPLILNGRAIAEATKRIQQDIIRATPFV